MLSYALTTSWKLQFCGVIHIHVLVSAICFLYCQQLQLIPNMLCGSKFSLMRYLTDIKCTFPPLFAGGWINQQNDYSEAYVYLSKLRILIIVLSLGESSYMFLSKEYRLLVTIKDIWATPREIIWKPVYAIWHRKPVFGALVDHLSYFCLVFGVILCTSVYWCIVVTCWKRADL